MLQSSPTGRRRGETRCAETERRAGLQNPRCALETGTVRRGPPPVPSPPQFGLGNTVQIRTALDVEMRQKFYQIENIRDQSGVKA
jgi:hypothetical protein